MAIIPANTPWTLDANWEELGNTPTQIFPAAGGSYWKTSNGARRRYTTSARKLSLGYFATAAMATPTVLMCAPGSPVIAAVAA